MQQEPEFRSDHDPAIAGTAMAPAPVKPPMGRRVRAWTIVSLIFGAVLAMAAVGIYVLRSSFQKRGGWDSLEIALELLLPLGFVLWFVLKTRIKTGKWTADAKARQATHARNKELLALNRGRPWSFWRYALTWAGWVAFERSCPMWQRVAGWAVLVGNLLFVLAMTAMGVIAIGAGADTLAGRGAIMVGFGLVLFVFPARAAMVLVRRRRAGQVRVSREELGALGAQRTAWRKRESEKPLRTKLLTTAMILLSYGFLWIRATVHHAQHPHESWITPAIYTPFALYLIWVQFRRPKGQQSAQSTESPTR